jgi:hypothetical protein
MASDERMGFVVGNVQVGENGSANIGIFGKSNSELLDKLPVALQAPYNASSQQDNALCLRETRTTVLKEMRAFVYGGGVQHIFWLNGMAGTGKSTIARTLAKELHERGMLGASFFFARSGGDVAHVGMLFATIAWQLTRFSAELKKLVCASIKDNPDIYTKSRNEQWATLIQQPLSGIRPSSPPQILVIILDALDECDNDNDMKGIVALLADAEAISSIRIRIVVTSRPETSIRLGFKKLPVILHRDLILDDCPRDEVNADICLFYYDRFGEIKDEQDWLADDWPAIDDVNRLVGMADGLFIFAATLCRFIAENEGPAEDCLSRILSSVREGSWLPQAENDDKDRDAFKNLDYLYVEILTISLRGRAQIAEGLKTTLGAIVVLEGPLSAISLERLMCYEGGPGVIYRQLDRLHSVLQVSRDPNSPIRVLHDSFRGFLVDRRRCTLPKLTIDKGSSHLHIFRKCLQTMDTVLQRDLCHLEHPGTMAEDLDQKKIETYLSLHVQYACRYWVSHLRHCTSPAKDMETELAAEVHAFLKVHLLHWVEAMWLEDFGGDEVSTIKVRPFNHIKTAALRLQKPRAHNHRRAKKVKLSKLSYTMLDGF